MKRQALLVLLGLCILAVALLNISYLQKVVISSDFSSPSFDNGPVLRRKKKQTKKTADFKYDRFKSGQGMEQAPPALDEVQVEKDHKVAGLSCEKYGGPSDEIAAEMVYWRDIPSDATFQSPFAKSGPEPKYLTFEPDEGGWNNIRMSMETAVAMAHAMGRILVLPPSQRIYLLWNDPRQSKKNKFTFKDFFHFDSIASEHAAVEVIHMEEFLKREAMTGHLRDKNTRQVTFPPNNKTDMEGAFRMRPFWKWLRNATSAPVWNFDKCVAGFGKEPGAEGAKIFEYYKKNMPKPNITHYRDNPTPVYAPAKERLKEMIAHRETICAYDEKMQSERVVHLMGDNDSGARMLVHFYAFLFFEDYHQDLWTKRFIRDHLRYIDEIQCAAASVVHAIRKLAKGHGDPNGEFDTIHIRRGDFQYLMTRLEADEIYRNVKNVLKENSTVFIATDEKNNTFFDPLREHYHLYFLSDFRDLVEDMNVNYFGMLDQLIASRGRVFWGAFYSTFTAYINRMRGYHSQKDKLLGYEKGELSSFYYAEPKHKFLQRKYRALQAPLWAREFPVGWRDIDNDVKPDQMISR